MRAVRMLRTRGAEPGAGDVGFTLIELLVVVVIIGILVAIAIPLYLSFRNGARDASAKSDVRQAVVAIARCSEDDGGLVPASATQSGSSVSFVGCPQTVRLSAGNTLTYSKTSASDYTVSVTATESGHTYTFDSTVGTIG